MIEAIKRTKSNATIYAVATVQEEIGLKGAKVSAFAIEPDVAIVLDTCIATDYPGNEKLYIDISLGKGVTFAVADASGRGLLTSKRILTWLIETARKYGIPYQLEVSDTRGTTEGSVVYLTKSGVPTAVVLTPLRYVHSPVELLDLNDLDCTANLTARALESVEKYFKK
jgi:endoglucanase